MLKIAVLGAGRMAGEILQVIDASDRCVVSGVWARSAVSLADLPVSADLPFVLAAADVAIDFTLATATSAVIHAVVAAGTPLVCGVSGLNGQQLQELASASRRIPLLYDRNMSYGIAVLTRLLQQAGKAFHHGFTTEIHETHHVHKVDAPSGTALLLGETVAASRGQSFADVYHYQSDGGHEAAPADAIRFFVTRTGEVPGDHRVVFRNASETVQLMHSVTDRRVFAEGAVTAACWLPRQSVGQYRMADVLAA